MTEEQLFATVCALVFAALCAGALYYLLRDKKAHPAGQLNSHVFLDLETMGWQHDAPILVIAAYAVDSLGNLIKSGQWNVDVEDAKKHGKVAKSTMKWWGDQSDAARRAAFDHGPRGMLSEALNGLTKFIESLDGVVYVWGNSPTFDCAILRHAYGQTGGGVPWEFWQERDCRTIAWLGEWLGYDAKRDLEFTGTPHTAIDDARHQARYTTAIMKYVGGVA